MLLRGLTYLSNQRVNNQWSHGHVSQNASFVIIKITVLGIKRANGVFHDQIESHNNIIKSCLSGIRLNPAETCKIRRN